MVVRSPCQENDPDAHPSAHKSVQESANPAWTRSVHLDAPGQRHGQQPVSGTADPGVVKQDTRGSVDTTKTCSGPQRVRMSSGERPVGATKSKQSDTTKALCQTPPSPAQTPGPSQIRSIPPTYALWRFNSGGRPSNVCIDLQKSGPTSRTSSTPPRHRLAQNGGGREGSQAHRARPLCRQYHNSLIILDESVVEASGVEAQRSTDVTAATPPAYHSHTWR